ncbi:MAG: HAD hydrolase-like protein, partial [Tepidisphaeraceae bacterium]
LRNLLRLDAVYTCYHDNADACACRKPAPGLILQAAREHDIDLSRSFMVGDRWSDVAAGVSAGCGGGTFLINLPYSQCERCKPDYTVASLLEAARKIVKLAGPG